MSYYCSAYTNKMLGYGRESDFRGVQLEVRTYADLQMLKLAEDEGRLRLGQEMTVFGLDANSELLHSIAFACAISTAKLGAKASDMTPIVRSVLEEWEHVTRSEPRGPITSVQRDGATIMNLALHAMLTEFVIDPNSAIGKRLFGEDGLGLLLFPRCCGRSADQPLVDGCDAKHVAKRFRQALKRE